MTEVKWIKITTNMFDDEKIKIIESMPEKDSILIIWIKLLTLAGKINANGYIFLTENIPYTDEMLATVFNRPLNVVRMALEIFKKFKMIDYDDNDILHITNWEKHQNIDGLDKIREQTRLRVARHRRKLRELSDDNVTVTLPVTQCNAIEEEEDKNKNKNKSTVPSPYPLPEGEDAAADFFTDIDDNKESEESGNTQNNTSEQPNPYTFYEQNFGTISPFTAEQIKAWEDEIGPVMVVEAMKEAIRYNAKNMKYIDRIVKNCYEHKIRTPAELQCFKGKRRKQKDSENISSLTEESYKPLRDYDFDPDQIEKIFRRGG